MILSRRTSKGFFALSFFSLTCSSKASCNLNRSILTLLDFNLFFSLEDEVELEGADSDLCNLTNGPTLINSSIKDLASVTSFSTSE